MIHKNGNLIKTQGGRNSGAHRAAAAERAKLARRKGHHAALSRAAVPDMTKILVLVVLSLAVYQGDCIGKPLDGYEEVEGLSEADYPDGETEVKRSPYQGKADTSNRSDPPNICYFIPDAPMESQLSCRLRFARSKFNFNPFGLRFGKRDRSTPVTKRVPKIFLPYLLKLRDKQLCGEEPGDNC